MFVHGAPRHLIHMNIWFAKDIRRYSKQNIIARVRDYE